MSQLSRLFFVALLVFFGEASAAPPSYDGSSEYGAVYINESSTKMVGSFGVRFNPGYQQNVSYIATSFDGFTIWFYGYDSSSRKAFSCWVFNGRSRTYPWDNFLDMALNAGNGMVLEVERYGDAEPGHEWNCKRAKLTKNSRQTH